MCSFELLTMMSYEILNNFSHLNSSVAHIVVVAEDSGQPPRRASVPVVVRYIADVAGSTLFQHAILKLANCVS